MSAMVMAILLAMEAQAVPGAIVNSLAAPDQPHPVAPNQPDAVDQLLQQAFVAVRAGRNAEALTYLDPLATAVIVNVGKAQGSTYCAQSPPEAMEYLARAISASHPVRLIQPRLCQILFVRAYALENLHRLPEALDQLQKLIELEPKFPHYQVEYAAALRQAGDNDNALATYHRAIELALPFKDYAPDHAAALRGIGFILTERGDLDGAERAYRQSLDLMPAHPIAVHELAYIAHLRATGLKTAPQSTESSINPALLPMPQSPH